MSVGGEGIMDTGSLVSITRCENVDDLKQVRDALGDALDLLGGLGTVVRPADVVVLKPNLLLPVDHRRGAVTNPLVAEALIDLLRDTGVGRILIGEGAVVGEDTDACFAASGFKEMASRKKVRLVDFKRDEFVPMGLSSGVVYRMLKIPRTVAEADVIIDLPVLKTHDCFPVSLGLKNMKGVIHERDKQKFHLLNLAQCIVDLNKLVLPRLTVIDGTIGMEGMGPVYGEPAHMQLFIASFDCVAADAVGSAVMGIDPQETSYISLAEEQGLGCADLSKIRIAGRSIESVRKSFKRITLEKVLQSEEFGEYGIAVVDAGGCSGCRSVLTALVSDLLERGKLSGFAGTTFVMGQNLAPKDLKAVEGPFVLVGSCTRHLRQERSTYLKGCPPHILDVKKALGYTKDDFEHFAFMATHLRSFGWS
jgi:uncharacterized protein (DUF362 family)